MTTLASDTFTGADGAAWSATWTTGKNATGGSALIASNAGRITTGSSGDRRVSRRVNITAPVDAVAVFKFQWSTGDVAFPRFYVRSTNTTLDTAGGYFVELNQQGSQWRIGVGNGSYSDTYFGSATSKTFSNATWYWVRFGVVGTAVKAKVWDDGASEPAWTYEVTDSAISAAGSGCGLTVGVGNNLAKFDVDDFALDDVFPSGASVTADSAPVLTVGASAAVANARPLDGTGTVTVGGTAAVTSSQGAAGAATVLTVGRTAAAGNSRPLAGTAPLTVGATAAAASARPADTSTTLTVGASAAANADRVLDAAPVITVGAVAVMDVSSATFVGIDSSPILTVGRVASVTSAQLAAGASTLAVGRSASAALNRPVDAAQVLAVGAVAGLAADRVLDGSAVLDLGAVATASRGQNLDAAAVLGVTRVATGVVNGVIGGPRVIGVSASATAVLARAGGAVQQTLISAAATMLVTSATPPSASTGWGGLLAIYREQAMDARRAELDRAHPVACPNDGEPLVVGPSGLRCPFDGWSPGF